MKPISLFLEYVIQNLVPLNEYSDKIVNALVKHYTDQAEDYGYDKLTPEQIKKYIARFDKIKDSVKNKEGLELFKMKGNDYEPLIELPKLIQLVTGAADIEAEPESDEDAYKPDTRPNVVYTSDDGKIVLYKGDKQNHCVRFREKETPDVSWCITRTLYDSYRYDRDRGYPVFYLAKNENLPSSDPKSAVAVQVTDPKLKGPNARYKWTNRKNSPLESRPMSWSELIGEVPWLGDIPNAEQELKYVELTPQEKEQVQYGSVGATIQDWLDKSYQQKIAYLDARASRNRSSYRNEKDLFSNVTDENFASRILPKFPSIAQHIAENVRILDTQTLLNSYDKFTKDVQKSIVSNMLTGGKKLDVKLLKDHSIPFQALLDITDRNGWNDPDRYYYSTKDRSAVVGLETDDAGKVTLSIYTPETSKENVKLSERTAKFIQQNAAPSKIPIRDLNGLIKNGVMASGDVIKSFEDDKKAPVALKREEDGDFVLDSRTLGIYKIDDSGFSKAPEDSAVSFDEELDSPEMRKKAVSLVMDAYKNSSRIPRAIDVATLSKIVAKTPYEDRTEQGDDDNVEKIIIAAPGEYPFINNADPNSKYMALIRPLAGWNSGGSYNRGPNEFESDAAKQAYIGYLKRANKTIKDSTLRSLLDDVSYREGIDFLNSKYPLDPENKLIPIIQDNTIFLINKDRPSENFRRGPNNTRLVSGKLSQARAEQMLRSAEPQRPTQTQIAQRVQQAQAARAEEPGQQPAAGEQPVAVPEGQLTGAQIQQTFTDRNISYTVLPFSIRNRIAAGGQTITQIRGDRGAETRNALLGNRGRITGIIRLTGRSSAIYFITLTSGTNIASIALQPGNYQYLATSNNAYQMRSVENLASVLQANNINEEIRKVYVREFLAHNPSMVNEVKTHLQKHLKERNMKKTNLHSILAEMLRDAIKENKPAIAPPPTTKPSTKPGPTITPKPGAKPGTKMENNELTSGEQRSIKKIVDRYKGLEEVNNLSSRYLKLKKG